MTNIVSIPERDALLAQAMAAAKSAVPKAEADSERPVFHFHTPAQWMNDPNGPIFYRGWYHVFYQFNPYGDGWGHMHWGHARSKNLVDWEHLPVALWPSKDKGEAHVFSGSTFENGSGQPTIFYTSISDKREPEQWMATPADADLLTFSKPDANPILTVADHKGDVIKEWRDPFLLSEKGKTFMVVGGGRNGRGVVLLYQAKDAELRTWDYRGVLFEHPDRNLPNVECPNLTRVGKHWVLLTSTHGKVEYFVGSLDVGRGTFTPHSNSAPHRGVLVDGAYASQIVADTKGKTVFLGWFQPPHGPGWAGCLTLPSLLSTTAEGALLCRPLPDLTQLRQQHAAVKNQPLNGLLDLTDRVTGNTAEIVARVHPQSATAFGLRLRVSPDNKTPGVEVRYEVATRTLHVSHRAPLVLPPSTSPVVELHVFLDKTVVEVYAGTPEKNGAAACMTAAKNARPSDTGLHFFAEGGTLTIESLDVYQLRPARFDLGAFR